MREAFTLDTLKGTVKSIIYRNAENGYSVIVNGRVKPFHNLMVKSSDAFLRVWHIFINHSLMILKVYSS